MSAPTPLKTAWLRWKSLKLPWRKKFLVGLDLQGNTFWEFRDTLSSHKHRMRRIVEYPSTVQYSDLNISPSWHQWLRHTRVDPPSLTEQSQDLVRQRNLKILAAEADRRWAEKPSFLDRPGQVRGQPVPALEAKEGYGTATVRDEMREGAKDVGINSAVGGGLGDTVQGTDRTVMEAVEGQNGESEISELRKNTMNERTKNSKLKEKKVDDPWKKARGGPSEEWQPQAWNPNR